MTKSKEARKEAKDALLDITQGIKRNLIDFCDGLCHAVA